MSLSAAPKTGVLIATAVGFVVTSIAFVMLVMTWIDPSDRSEYFWRRIIWTEFLVGLEWAYVGGFFSLLLRGNRSVKGFDAILPSLGAAIFFYVASSLLLMIVAAFWPGANSWELVSQLYEAAGLVVILIFLYFSWAAGVTDTEPIPPGISTPHALAALVRKGEGALLARQTSNADAELTEGLEVLALGLKALRERIEHSIPHASRIGEESSYLAFSRVVKQLSDDCLQLATGKLDVAGIQICIRRVNDLKNEIQHIVQSLRSS